MAPPLNLTGANLNDALATTLPEAFGTVKPLIFFVLGIAVYSFFIFKFYRFLAERDILKLKWHKKYSWHEGFLVKAAKTFFYLLEHVILVPAIVFFWFAIMAVLLLFLSKNPPDQIMLISMAIIGAVRITAYYSDDLSRDLAKMIPFALLGVFLVDFAYIDIGTVWASFYQLPLYLNNVVFYLVFVVGLELVMRIFYLIYRAAHPERTDAKQE
ncbi:hypothetical protein JXA12_03800 [Candidatus Woesearchaeota archaeon]|nr:hypothetical protein [Candidatus Woesearchaeota archaeon]